MNFAKTFGLSEDRASLYKTLMRNVIRKLDHQLTNTTNYINTNIVENNHENIEIAQNESNNDIRNNTEYNENNNESINKQNISFNTDNDKIKNNCDSAQNDILNNLYIDVNNDDLKNDKTNIEIAQNKSENDQTINDKNDDKFINLFNEDAQTVENGVKNQQSDNLYHEYLKQNTDTINSKTRIIPEINEKINKLHENDNENQKSYNYSQNNIIIRNYTENNDDKNKIINKDEYEIAHNVIRINTKSNEINNNYHKKYPDTAHNENNTKFRIKSKNNDQYNISHANNKNNEVAHTNSKNQIRIKTKNNTIHTEISNDSAQKNEFEKLCNDILTYSDFNTDTHAQNEKFSETVLKLFVNRDLKNSENVLRKYQEVLRILNRKISIRQESRYVVLLTTLSILISVNYPETSLNKHMSENVWVERVKTLTDKMFELSKLKNNNKANFVDKSNKNNINKVDNDLKINNLNINDNSKIINNISNNIYNIKINNSQKDIKILQKHNNNDSNSKINNNTPKVIKILQKSNNSFKNNTSDINITDNINKVENLNKSNLRNNISKVIKIMQKPANIINNNCSKNDDYYNLNDNNSPYSNNLKTLGSVKILENPRNVDNSSSPEKFNSFDNTKVVDSVKIATNLNKNNIKLKDNQSKIASESQIINNLSPITKSSFSDNVKTLGSVKILGKPRNIDISTDKSQDSPGVGIIKIAGKNNSQIRNFLTKNGIKIIENSRNSITLPIVDNKIDNSLNSDTSQIEENIQTPHKNILDHVYNTKHDISPKGLKFREKTLSGESLQHINVLRNNSEKRKSDDLQLSNNIKLSSNLLKPEISRSPDTSKNTEILQFPDNLRNFEDIQLSYSSLSPLSPDYISLTDNSGNSIFSLFESFVSSIQITYFTASFYILNFITNNNVDVNKKQVLLYFVSFYLSVIGDLFKYSENESTRDFSIDFYSLATKIWPKYSRPYKCIANWHFAKGLYQETFYFYACAFLCMTRAERFSIARQDLSVFSIAVAEKVKLWKERLKEKQQIRIYCKANFINSDLYIFYIKTIPNAVLFNEDRPIVLRDFNYNFYDFSGDLLGDSIKDLFNTLINLFVYDFLFITIKMINKVDISELSENIDKWHACFNALCVNESFYKSEFFDSFPTFAVILIYTMENILHEPNDESNQIISVFIKIFLIFNDNVVYILRKCKNDSLIVPLVKFLCFTLRCFGYLIESPLVRSVLFKQFLECNTLYISELYSFVKNKVTAFTDITEINDFKILGNSSLKIHESSEIWTKFSLFENKADIQVLYCYILSCVKYLVSSEYMFFKISNDLLVFDPFKFSALQSKNTQPHFLEFFLKSDKLWPPRLKMFLFERIFISKNNKIHLSVIQSICPDTNTFLMNKNSVMKNPLLDHMKVLISKYVLRELFGLRRSTQKANISDWAYEAYDVLTSKMISSRLMKILMPGGTITEFNYNFESSNFRNGRSKEIETHFDDRILKDILKYEKKISKLIRLDSKMVFIHPIIFITNDVIFQLKMSHSDIPTFSSRTLLEISNLIEIK